MNTYYFNCNGKRITVQARNSIEAWHALSAHIGTVNYVPRLVWIA